MLISASNRNYFLNLESGDCFMVTHEDYQYSDSLRAEAKSVEGFLIYIWMHQQISTSTKNVLNSDDYTLETHNHKYKFVTIF